MFNIYRMLFLVLKKVWIVKFSTPKIPTAQHTSSPPRGKIQPHPSTNIS